MISDTEDIVFISGYCQIEPCKCKYFIHISFYINSEQDQDFKIQNTLYKDPCELVTG